ncbi:MAG: peptidoglycan DD-metalloendopeptidase family protein [Pseudanabaena sp. M135S2SP2A07QC]|jgi:murein DD-endopeptidase MepM/ murein hydrolase activator NlpD|nr:peptidoglycan DD-metalloendopeptidase family protein [Pseudanabaena sp. M110S1SP2A07QC]MCA6530104.1 peptidoglycan DD-metalloendopeptidase family protein [Pseudanabaena sp. M125S2SP2A07QC]MCA6536176.1 peptidoglycan DD-metalloendopeptidase family protein [Pseudanabaena sp. M176S2SP2A07QC]MCA6539689.1 peptidoglycan DD-metalloendopeptidase family protein [Pseudanabaena sp. M037S2SP2A07QC]MCA6547021.1 peptidoglycan DD-metalloendopeptidase family protein [Pseudanabaena sp. M152S2SP2A07QC]MCA65511
MLDRRYWQEIISKPWLVNYPKIQQIGKLIARQFFGLRLVILAIAVCCVLALSQVAPAQAQSVDELKNYQNFVDQQRQIIQKQQEQINALTKPAQSRLDALRRNVRVTDAQIKDNEKKIRQAREQLQTLNTKLQELEYDLNKRRGATTARLQYLQRQQLQRWWVTLLSSQDLNQFADRRRQIERIYDRDRKLLADLSQRSNQVEKQRNQIVAQKNEIELLTQKLKYQKSNIESEAVAQQNTINRLKSDRQALSQAEDRLAEDSRRLSQIILSKVQPYDGLILPSGTGQLMYPTIGPVTSKFGWRTHPILGTERFHSGIDFGADYGSLIYASEQGRVIYADWYGGYGNAVIVDHGNGMTTLYAHCSDLYVKDGDVVAKGQPIAAVGSTGFSTGPHLHFELRANGEPIDPAAYL